MWQLGKQAGPISQINIKSGRSRFPAKKVSGGQFRSRVVESESISFMRDELKITTKLRQTIKIK